MKYCVVVHLLLGGAAVLVLDVEVEGKRRGILLLAVIETALELLVQLVLRPPDEAPPNRTSRTLSLVQTTPHTLFTCPATQFHLPFQVLVFQKKNLVFVLEFLKGRFKIDLSLGGEVSVDKW